MTISIARPMSSAVAGSPFDLDDEPAYQTWRARKLDALPNSVAEVQVDIHNANRLTGREMAAVQKALQRVNFVIYTLTGPVDEDKSLMRRLGRQFGLERLDSNLCSDADGITSLKVVERRQEGEYIPYTNKRLNWHTDGYYNSLDRQIRSVILHCVQPAAAGGESALMDHEIAYIRLRDEDPEFIRVLMTADAMTIPANVQNGRQVRPAQTGPVFSLDVAGHLHMRYSARTRNIVWKQDSTTQAAAGFLLNLFRLDSADIFRHRLKSGQGVLSNNVLHCRSSFENDDAAGQSRLLYRARYFDRIIGLRGR